MATVKIHPYFYFEDGNCGILDTVLNIPASTYNDEYRAILDGFLSLGVGLEVVLQDLLDNNPVYASLVDGPLRTLQPFLSNERQVHILAWTKATAAQTLKRAYNWLCTNPSASLTHGLENLAIASEVCRLMFERLVPADKKYVTDILSRTSNDVVKREMYFGLYGYMLPNEYGQSWNTKDVEWKIYDDLFSLYQQVPPQNKWGTSANRTYTGSGTSGKATGAATAGKATGGSNSSQAVLAVTAGKNNYASGIVSALSQFWADNKKAVIGVVILAAVALAVYLTIKRLTK